ncbi:hypothetical protein LSTR_LSTR009205 [Laodelphax striatellus]|uniref:Uncharacterized protein n=1 Tax=Laodelphax striatellus TaxID=195883 RepID=A0A482WQA4_LAOST|nr:hypothetical protein LSTR_LSTR009205 [Laodelphax striatellus]
MKTDHKGFRRLLLFRRCILIPLTGNEVWITFFEDIQARTTMVKFISRLVVLRLGAPRFAAMKRLFRRSGAACGYHSKPQPNPGSSRGKCPRKKTREST